MSTGSPTVYKKIIAAVDGSPASIRAASQAAHIAKMAGAELLIIHAVQEIKQGGVIGLRARYGDVTLVDAFRKVMKEDAEKMLAPIVKSATDSGTKVKSEIIVDEDESEAGAIIKYAEKHGADLIVVGSKGKSRFERILLGGVASKIVSAAKCQVLIMR